METGLSKIEIITSFTKFAELQKELSHLGVRGMTVMQVLGCGIQKGSADSGDSWIRSRDRRGEDADTV